MNQTVRKSTLGHLPGDLQHEITDKLMAVDARMQAMGLDERGSVRHWLRDGQPPTEQFAMALRDAPLAEWEAYVTDAIGRGQPPQGALAAKSRAGHELMHRWKAVIAEIRKRVPEGADLNQWPGYVALAARMIEMEEAENG